MRVGGLTPAASAYEVTQDTVPQTVWQLQIGGGQYAYSVMRLPSLYPGVQWYPRLPRKPTAGNRLVCRE